MAGEDGSPARRLSPAAAASAAVTSAQQEVPLGSLAEERGFICAWLPSAPTHGGPQPWGHPPNSHLSLLIPQPRAGRSSPLAVTARMQTWRLCGFCTTSTNVK